MRILLRIIVLFQVIATLSMVFFIQGSALAGEYHLLAVDRLDLEYQKLDPSNRDPYAPTYTGYWRERAVLHWDLKLIGFLYWRNNIHTETFDPGGQVKTVGWEWEAGAEVGKYLDLFHYHHSRHVLDEGPLSRFNGQSNQFPVDNSYGVRIHLLQGDRK